MPGVDGKCAESANRHVEPKFPQDGADTGDSTFVVEHDGKFALRGHAVCDESGVLHTRYPTNPLLDHERVNVGAAVHDGAAARPEQPQAPALVAAGDITEPMPDRSVLDANLVGCHGIRIADILTADVRAAHDHFTDAAVRGLERALGERSVDAPGQLHRATSAASIGLPTSSPSPAESSTSAIHTCATGSASVEP